jgi:hypothetical protein
MKPDAFDGLRHLAGNRDLLYDFINTFPLPIQVYAPDGLLIAANPTFLSEFRTQPPVCRGCADGTGFPIMLPENGFREYIGPAPLLPRLRAG